ncbi:MAG: BlaI/MecI/CopY family transcriptional regulator [Clostridiales bacterium]|nr:BlaI/MecI/CopY family transcriptional regulator [Clostridiales bacterium]
MIHKEKKTYLKDTETVELNIPNLADGEYHFAEIIWENEPINSTALVKLANEKLGWKKPTAYTVLRKLCEKGIMKNENAIVTSVIPREKIQQSATIEFMSRNFHNSVPAFLAAFLKHKSLKQEEIKEIQQMLMEAEREDD